MQGLIKRTGQILLLCSVICLFSGCGKNTDPGEVTTGTTQAPVSTTTTTTTMETTTEDPYALDEGMMYSNLSGLPVSEEFGNRRPFAIVFNNIEVASPQCGTSQAAILYEALSEGGITRLMGIFEDFDSDRIGSCRSARHYLVSVADEYDAIFVHYGHTKYALSKIRDLGVNNISGLSSIEPVAFYRDHSIRAPHNAFTSYEGILKATEKLNYRTELRENAADNHFSFRLEAEPLKNGSPAKKITLGFSSYTAPYFIYQEDTKTYDRYQFNTEHIDKNTGETLTFENIIVQYVKEWDIDHNGYQTMELSDTSGKGLYLTEGSYEEITWEKNESNRTMSYYGPDGKQLVLNPGKTYIALFPSHRESKLVIEGEEQNAGE